MLNHLLLDWHVGSLHEPAAGLGGVVVWGSHAASAFLLLGGGAPVFGEPPVLVDEEVVDVAFGVLGSGPHLAVACEGGCVFDYWCDGLDLIMRIMRDLQFGRWVKAVTILLDRGRLMTNTATNTHRRLRLQHHRRHVLHRRLRPRVFRRR